MDQCNPPSVDECLVAHADVADEPEYLMVLIKEAICQLSKEPDLVAEELGLPSGWFHNGDKDFPKWHQLKRLAEVARQDIVVICGRPECSAVNNIPDPDCIRVEVVRPAPKFGGTFLPYNGDDAFANWFLNLLVDDVLEEEGAEGWQDRSEAYHARINASPEVSFVELDSICRELGFVLRFWFGHE
jgi:hypothetical protein